MNRLFCDTLYFTALINPKDQWHQSAIEVEPLVETLVLVTTEKVLVEIKYQRNSHARPAF